MKEKTIVYDSTPDMKIKLQDGRVVTLDELEPMVMEAGKLFAYAPWSTSKNPRPTRILASISADGLSLFDFKTRISHRWVVGRGNRVMPDFERVRGVVQARGWGRHERSRHRGIATRPLHRRGR